MSIDFIVYIMTNTNTEIYIIHYDNKDIVNSHIMIRHVKKRTQKSLLSMKKCYLQECLHPLFCHSYAIDVSSFKNNGTK